jgi:hypothetical protein
VKRRLAPVFAAAGAALFSPPANAVEREHHLGLDAGGLVESDESPDVGISLGAHWAYGLNDAWNLMAEASWSFVSLGNDPPGVTPPRRPSSIGNADVGVGYVFDVIRWVPYAGLMAGGYDLSGGTVGRATFLPGGVIAIGVDYRVGRSLAIGVAAREHMFLTELSRYPSYSQVFARVEYTWGW